MGTQNHLYTKSSATIVPLFAYINNHLVSDHNNRICSVIQQLRRVFSSLSAYPSSICDIFPDFVKSRAANWTAQKGGTALARPAASGMQPLKNIAGTFHQKYYYNIHSNKHKIYI